MAALAFSLGACTDEEPKYNPAEVPESLPVYFSYEDNNEIEVSENTRTIEIPVYRKDAGAALTVPVKAQVTPSQNGFTFPANVTFASGSKESTIVVGVDMTKVQARTDYAVTVSVGNGVVTPYYTDKISYRFNYNPWNPMVGPDGETTGVFYDGLVAPLYGLDAVPYDVKIETNPTNDKIIRVVDPYGPIWPYYEDGMYDTSEHHYMYFNISKPNQVFLSDADGVALGTGKSDPWYKSGLTLDSDGEIYLTGMGNYDLSMGRTPDGASYGTLSQGNITYGVDQWAVMFKDDPKGSIYYGNRDGNFRIILPGYEMYVDPSTVWTVIGKGKFTDGILYPLVFMEDDETQEDIPVYEVEVAQFGGDPNMYRIMNPYKKGICPYGIDYSGDKYIEIDATDPDCLNIELQATGINLGAPGIWKLFFDAAISSVPYAFCVAEMVAVLSPAVMVIVACCCSSTLLPSQFRTSWSATSSFSMVSQPALTASYFHVVLVWMSTTTSPPRLLKPIEALRSSSAANHVFFDEMPSSAAMPDGSSPGTGLV